MPIVYGDHDNLVTFIFESANFASGGGTLTLGIDDSQATNGATSAVAQAAADAFVSAMIPGMDEHVLLATVRCEDEFASVEIPVNEPGDASVTAPPPQVAVIWARNAAGKGPRQRGRSFLFGFSSEGQMDERGVLAGSQITSIQTRVEDFIFELGNDANGPYRLSIPQSDNPGQQSQPNVPWPVVMTNVIRPIVGTQRRRVRS